MQNTAILVQARMSSKRCPGKILEDLNGAPLLQRLLESLERNQHNLPVIVCSSLEESDDPVESFCNDRGQTLFRGVLNDVAGRFLAACEQHDLKHLIRISGDSPWFHVSLVDQITELYRHSNADLACNIYPRTFPKGQSIEMFSYDLLKKFYKQMDENDKEHVTPIFYRHADQLNIKNLEYERDVNQHDLSIDLPEQLQVCREHFKSLKKPHWDYNLSELLELYQLA